MGEKTRVVLDTNIWISIFLSKVLAREFEKLLIEEKIEIFTSKEILKEISRVLEYPKIKKILESSGIRSKEVIEEILKVSTVVNPKEKFTVIEEDPEDNKFVECAVEACAEFLVSGDKHLLNLGQFKGIKIISAREFLDKAKRSYAGEFRKSNNNNLNLKA